MTDALLRGRPACARRTATSVVLDDVDLTVEPHDVVCLIGSSGSGKSTLLRCLNLLEHTDDGTIVVRGRRGLRPARRPRARCASGSGMVFQAYNLFPHLTVLDNCTLAPRARARQSPGPRRRRGRASCSSGSASPTRRPRTRTGSPAASSSASPSYARSPPSRPCCSSTRSPPRSTPSSSARCSTSLRDLAEQGTTMVLATHEMAFARDVATKVCFLDGGRILERARPSRSSAPQPRNAPASSCAGCCRPRSGHPLDRP